MTAKRDAEVCGICYGLTMSRITATRCGITVPICEVCARNHGVGRGLPVLPAPHDAD